MISSIILTALAATSMIQNTYVDDGFNNDYQNEVLECSIEQEKSKQEPLRLVGEDEYEPNDNPENPAWLYYQSDYLLDSYQNTIYATLDGLQGYVDCDYYYFNLLTDSDVEISVSTIDSYSFDFIVYEYDYFVDSNHPEIANHVLNDVYSDYSSNQSKSFSDTLTSGTYIIYLNGQQPFNSYYTINYVLELDVSKSWDDYDSFSVGQMKYSKGLPGAVWISDYIPCDIFPFSSNEDSYLYYSTSNQYQNIGLEDYSLDFLKSIATNDEIRVATIYIWDSELKYVLYQTLSTLKDIIEQQLANQTMFESNINVIENTISGTLNIVGTLSGLIINNPITSVAVSLLANVTDDLINSFLDFLIPKYPIDLSDYVDALDIMISELLVYDINGQPQTTQTGALQVDNSGIFVFPIYYEIYFGNNNNNHYFSYLQTYEHIVSLNNPHTQLFSDDYYEEIDNISLTDYCHCRGKLYALSDDILSFEDLTLVSEVENLTPILNNWSINVYDNTSGSSLDSYQYRWHDIYANIAGQYHFVFKFEMNNQFDDIVIEQFASPFGGYGQIPIATYNKNFTQTSGTVNYWVIYFSKTFAANEHMYIRVRGINYHPTNYYYALVKNNKNDAIGNLNHLSHNYDTFSWVNYNQHQALCTECGNQTLQPHAISANSVPFHGYYTCLLCGGPARFGVIGQSMDISYVIGITNNGSIQLNNGLLVIVDDDLHDLYHNCLVFHDYLPKEA